MMRSIGLIQFRSDGFLVRDALRKSPGAFEELIFRYQKKAHAISRAMGVGADRADDVVQEAFLKGFEHLGSLRDPSSFGGWFLAIVRNTARSMLREDSSRALLAEARDVDELERIERSDFGGYLWRKVEDLPEGIREAIFLYYYEGESTRAVAKALGINRSIVKNRLHRGRRLLEEKLWREMRECLRDMLPSVREWRKKGRRLTLLTLSALSLSRAMSAGFPAHAGSPAPPPAPAATPPVGLSLFRSFLARIARLNRASLMVPLAVLLIIGGVAHWSRRGAELGGPPGEGERPVAAKEAAPRREAARIADPAAPPLPGAAAEAGEEPAAVSGRITDLDGNPLAGAGVLAIDLARWDVASGEWTRVISSTPKGVVSRLDVMEGAYRRAGQDAPRKTTGADGVYAFRGLRDGIYRILASHPEHLPGTETTVPVRLGSPVKRDIALVPAQCIAGKVVDESGRPVEGASVSGTRSDDARLRGTDRLARTLAGWEEGRILLDDGRARTDAGGVFRLTGLEPVAYDLIVRKQGFLAGLAFSIPAGSADAVVALARGSTITGRVLSPSHAHVSGARVNLSPGRSGEVHRLLDSRHADHMPDPGRIAVTGEDGAYRLEALDPGEYVLSVSAKGHPQFRRDLAVSGAVTELEDAVLEAPRTISGTVRALDGTPIEKAPVWVQLPRDLATTASRAEWTQLQWEPEAVAYSDAEGRFLLSCLPEGPMDVKADKWGFVPACVRAAAGTSDLQIVLREGLTVHGRVVDEAGAPVQWVAVKIPARDGKNGVSDAEGRFVLQGVPVDSASSNGQVMVEIRHPLFMVEWFRESIHGHGDAASPLIIRIPSMTRLAGKVMDGSGRAVGGTRVWIEATGLPRDERKDSPFIDSRSLSGKDGSFSVGIWHHARWVEGDMRIHVVASHPSLGSGRAGPFPLPPTGRGWPDVEVVLAPGVTVDGIVTGEDGAPVAGAQVVLDRLEVGVDRYARGVFAPEKVGYSLADGRFEVRGAERGPSAITVRAMGFAPRRIEGVEAGEMQGPIAIVLQRGRSITGRVVDQDGAPIALADVVAVLSDDAGGGESEFARRMDLRMEPGIASALTGMDGRYRLGPLPPGSFHLVGRCEGHEVSRIGPVSSGTAPDLVLARFAAVRGVVLESETRKPVPRFRIDLMAKKETGPSEPEDGWSQGDIEFDDIDGRFLYDGLRPGKYSIFLRSWEFVPARYDIVLGAGDVLQADLELKRGFRIDGVAVDAESGTPVAGAQVFAMGKGAPLAYHDYMLRDVASAADGSFSIGGLSPGGNVLFAVHPHYASSEREGVAFRMPDARSAGLEVRLRPAGRLQGWIDGLEPFMGKAAADRPLLVLTGVGAEGDTAIEVEPTGRFRADHLEPGSRRIELRMGGSDVPGRVLGEVEIRPRETTYRTFDVR